MDFNLSKEQELLRDGLTKFLATRYDLAKSRTAAHTGAGWQPEIWRGFAEELGILGATFPEEIGGIGGGIRTVCTRRCRPRPCTPPAHGGLPSPIPPCFSSLMTR